MKDSVKVVGQPTITLLDGNGNVKQHFTVPNLVVSRGKEYLASRAVGATTVMSHMAIGTDNTAVNSTNETLGAEIGRVAISTSTSTANVITYTAQFGPGVGTGALTEAAIFNDSTAGMMLCRTVFNVVNKDSVDTIYFSWDITIN